MLRLQLVQNTDRKLRDEMVEMRGQVDSSIEVAEQNFRDMTAQAGSQTQSALTASLKAEVNSAIFIAEVRSQAPS